MKTGQRAGTPIDENAPIWPHNRTYVSLVTER